MKSKILGLLAVGLLAGPMAANASLVEGIWDFSVSATNGQTYTGRFSFTGLDTTQNYVDSSAAGFSFSSPNLPTSVVGGIGFTFNPDVDLLVLGGLDDGVGSWDTGDWYLAITSFAFDPAVGYFETVLEGEAVTARTATITSVPVPEPGTLALLGLGLAGLGLSRRRKTN